MSPDLDVLIERLRREMVWRSAQWSAERLVALLDCMKAHRRPLPEWCRGAMSVRP
jgi:hypothetical protein